MNPAYALKVLVLLTDLTSSPDETVTLGPSGTDETHPEIMVQVVCRAPWTNGSPEPFFGEDLYNALLSAIEARELRRHSEFVITSRDEFATRRLPSELALRRIQELLQTLFASSRAVLSADNTPAREYVIKYGPIHQILGIMDAAGYAVDSPVVFSLVQEPEYHQRSLTGGT